MKIFIISLLPFFLFACLSTEDNETTDVADVTNIKDDTSEDSNNSINDTNECDTSEDSIDEDDTSIDYCAVVAYFEDHVASIEVPPPAVNSACNCQGFLQWSSNSEYIYTETTLPKPGQDCDHYECSCGGINSTWRCMWFYIGDTSGEPNEYVNDCVLDEED